MIRPKTTIAHFSWFWFGWDNPFTYFLRHSSASTHPPLYLIILHCQKEVLFASIKEYPMQPPWKFALLSHSCLPPCLPPSFWPLLSLIAYIEWSYCKKEWENGKKERKIEFLSQKYFYLPYTPHTFHSYWNSSFPYTKTTPKILI